MSTRLTAFTKDELDKVFREIAEEKLAEIKTSGPTEETPPEEGNDSAPEDPKEPA